MPKIVFKGKSRAIRFVDGTLAGYRIHVPALSSQHYDLREFRADPRWSMFANSDLFRPMLTGRLKAMGVPVGSYLDYMNLPPRVQIDATGFLDTVTICV